MRATLPTALGLTLAAIVAGALAPGAAVAAPVTDPLTGHYEARADDGAHLSYFVRKRGDAYRVENLIVFRRCGGEGELQRVNTRPMRVDDGAFAPPERMQPLLGIRGMITARARAMVSVGPAFGCAGRVRFRANRVNRAPVRPGLWTGTDATGQPLSFRVDRWGRVVDHLRVNTAIECPVGALGLDDSALLGRPVPVLAGSRRFSGREADARGDAVRAVGGRFTAAGAARGELRVVRMVEGRSCDSGLVAWTARHSPAPAS